MDKNIQLRRQQHERARRPGLSHSTWVVCAVIGTTWIIGAGLLLVSLRGYQEVKHRVQAPLKGTNLAHAQLASAPLPGRDLSHTNLQGADLQGADLHNANLTGCNLNDATLDDADLRGVNLRGASLRGAHLINANLLNANLHGADLRGANLQAMYLQGIDLTGARCDRATLWPQHFDPTQHGATAVKSRSAPSR